MSSYAPNDIPAIVETVAPKADNLDWENLPQEPCELEFRPGQGVTLAAHVRAFALLALASAIAPVASWLAGKYLAASLANWQSPVAAAALGIVLMAGYEWRRWKRFAYDLPHLLNATAMILLFGPLFIWAAVALTNQLARPVGAFVYFHILAIPALLALSDRMATHTAHWLTASLQVDHDTMLSWRQDWHYRFLTDARLVPPEPDSPNSAPGQHFTQAARARNAYLFGIFWIAGATITPTVFLLLMVRNSCPRTIGLQVLVAVTCGLAGAALLRTGGNLSLLASWWRSLVHWLHYGSQAPTPPWVFQGPCGPVWLRRLALFAVVALISVPITHFALPTTTFLVSTAANQTSFSGNTQSSVPVHDQATTSAATTSAEFRLFQWTILVASAVGCAALLPGFIFFLGSLLFIGPLISAYSDTLEP